MRNDYVRTMYLIQPFFLNEKESLMLFKINHYEIQNDVELFLRSEYGLYACETENAKKSIQMADYTHAQNFTPQGGSLLAWAGSRVDVYHKLSTMIKNGLAKENTREALLWIREWATHPPALRQLYSIIKQKYDKELDLEKFVRLMEETYNDESESRFLDCYPLEERKNDYNT